MCSNAPDTPAYSQTDNKRPLITVRFANATDAAPERRQSVIARLMAIINPAYSQAERGLWRDSKRQRINEDGLSALLACNQLLLAECNNNIVGCVKYTPYSDEVVGMGLLAADTRLHGLGIGRELVRAFEAYAEKHYRVIQLELLVPINGRNANKEHLKRWYGRLGFRYSHVEPFSNHADDAEELLIPCQMEIWHKPLLSASPC